MGSLTGGADNPRWPPADFACIQPGSVRWLHSSRMHGEWETAPASPQRHRKRILRDPPDQLVSGHWSELDDAARLKAFLLNATQL